MLPRRAEAISIHKNLVNASSYFSPTFLRDFNRELKGDSIDFRFQQIDIFKNFFFKYYEKPVEEKIILEIFEIKKNQYDRQKNYISSPIKSFSKKKTELDEHQEEFLIECIRSHYLDYSPLRKIEILELAQKNQIRI